MCEDSSCDSLTSPGDRLDLRDALTCDILSVTYGCDCTGCHCIYDPRPPPSPPPPTPPPPTPPSADVCDCDDAAASDECKETCDAIGAAAGIIGAALILAIVLPIVGCLLVALLVALVVYCCCCKGKKAAAGAPAQPTAVEITKTAV